MGIFKGKASSASGGGYELVEPGNHAAVLVAMVDLGTHEEEYQGVAKNQHKVYLVWELVNEKSAGSTNNQLISADYTLSFHKKAKLRLLAEQVRGKAWADNDDIDYAGMLGKPCQVTVTHQHAVSSGNPYAKVAGVSALAKGVQMGPAKNKPATWSLDDGLPALESIAAWVPFLRGESVVEVVKRCHELSRREPATPTPPKHGGMRIAESDLVPMTNGDIHEVDDGIAF